MKKRITIISVITCLILGTFFYGVTSRILTDRLSNAEKYAAVIKIFEAEYLLTKNYNTLCYLCDALTFAAQKSEGSDKINNKHLKYLEILLDESKYGTEENFVSCYNFEYPAFLNLILISGNSEKFKTAFEAFIDNDITDSSSFFTLSALLRDFSKTANDKNRQWAKETAKKIIDGGYIITNSLEKYMETAAQYQEIIDIY